MQQPLNDRIFQGDALSLLRAWPDNFIDCCLTSPPYWCKRDYGVDGQLGLEPSPKLYTKSLVAVFEQVRRVLKPHGTLWLNLGDTYISGKGRSGSRGAEYQAERRSNGTSINSAHQTLGGAGQTKPNDNRAMMRANNLKSKDLAGVPWQVAFALRDAGWWLRSEIIWAKPNPIPESVKDRPTTAHETIFLFSKSQKYFFDHEAIKEPSLEGGFRNARTVWQIPTQPKIIDNHFAMMPEALAEKCILAGCPKNGIVLDPFVGAGTTAIVAQESDRHFLGIDLNPKYCKLARKRVHHG